MRLYSILCVVLVASVLLDCVSAEGCELASRLREGELQLFAKFSPPTSGGNPPRTGCITWSLRYWSYELCPGRWIRQYRKDGGVIVEENILGVQHSWSLKDELGLQLLHYKDGDQTVPDRLSDTNTTFLEDNSLYECYGKKQVNVLYPDGSLCASSFHYHSLVRFVCIEDIHEPLVKAVESNPCRYDITVVSNSICEIMLGPSETYINIPGTPMIFAI